MGVLAMSEPSVSSDGDREDSDTLSITDCTRRLHRGEISSSPHTEASLAGIELRPRNYRTWYGGVRERKVQIGSTKLCSQILMTKHLFISFVVPDGLGQP
jgi:hypothetical protein